MRRINIQTTSIEQLTVDLRKAITQFQGSMTWIVIPKTASLHKRLQICGENLAGGHHGDGLPTVGDINPERLPLPALGGIKSRHDDRVIIGFYPSRSPRFHVEPEGKAVPRIVEKVTPRAD